MGLEPPDHHGHRARRTSPGNVARVLAAAEAMTPLGRTAALVGGFGAAFVLDWLTGPEISLLLGYALVVGAAAWLSSARVAALWAGASSVGTAVVRLSTESQRPHVGVTVVNATLRCITLALFGAVVSSLAGFVATTQSEAETDALTGLLNRKATLARVEAGMARATVVGRPFSVVYWDLDDLKVTNDRWGHARGDELLRAFATTVTQGTRPGDTLGRVGGDEFVLICPGADEADAQRIVARLTGLDRLPSASFGVATQRADDDATSLLHRADAVMYVHKSGRRGPSPGPGDGTAGTGRADGPAS